MSSPTINIIGALKAQDHAVQGCVFRRRQWHHAGKGRSKISSKEGTRKSESSEAGARLVSQISYWDRLTGARPSPDMTTFRRLTFARLLFAAACLCAPQ